MKCPPSRHTGRMNIGLMEREGDRREGGREQGQQAQGDTKVSGIGFWCFSWRADADGFAEGTFGVFYCTCIYLHQDHRTSSLNPSITPDRPLLSVMHTEYQRVTEPRGGIMPLGFHHTESTEFVLHFQVFRNTNSVRLLNQWNGPRLCVRPLCFAVLCSVLLWSLFTCSSPLFGLGLQVGKRVSGHDGAQGVRSLIVIRCPDVCYVFLFLLSHQWR